LTCLATIVIASLVGAGTGTVIDRVTNLPYLWKRRRPGPSRSRP
jgi:hypothetical protein